MKTKTTKKTSTGMRDNLGAEIFLGNRLWCMDGYNVIVKKDKNGYYGKLVCKKSNPCANVRYSLNNGKGYMKYDIPCGK